MSSGFSILHDGTVTQWTGRGATITDARVLGRLDVESHTALLAFLAKAGLPDVRQQETGNMTTSLRITRGEEEFLYSWPGLHLRKEEVPPSVRSLVETVWGSIEPFVRQTP